MEHESPVAHMFFWGMFYISSTQSRYLPLIHTKATGRLVCSPGGGGKYIGIKKCIKEGEHTDV